MKPRSGRHRRTYDESGKRICFTCGEAKPPSAYSKYRRNKDGLNGSCRDCVKSSRGDYVWAHSLKRLYGLTEAEYLTLVAKQHGLCAICGRKPRRRLAVDHDHLTGKVRGLLCDPCNVSLGHFGDSVTILERAIAYLRGA